MMSIRALMVLAVLAAGAGLLMAQHGDGHVQLQRALEIAEGGAADRKRPRAVDWRRIRGRRRWSEG